MTVVENTAAAQPALSAPVLQLEGITKRFGPQVAVNNLTLSIARNEVVGLIGENGAGKSTLLKILTGVHQPDQGVIRLNGRDMRFRTPLEAVAHGVGIVHQEQSLFTNLSVAENIVMGASSDAKAAVRFGFYRWGRINDRAADILQQVGFKMDPRRIVSELSFAERQMVEIARTIELARQAAAASAGGSGACPLVILDEPTSVLERQESEALEREIGKLKTIGSVIFVSHRLDEVLRICDRIVVMRHGSLVADRSTADVTEDELFRLMIGHAARAPGARAPARPREAPVVSARGLGRRGAFRGIDFELSAGRVLAIVGTFGSGREELCRAVYGAETFDAGTLHIDDRPVERWTVRKAVKAGLGYLPSERVVEGIVGGMSAAQNLTLTKPGKSRIGPFLSPAARNEMADHWFEALDIRPRNPGQDLGRFSGGNQQKVALARWLTEGCPKLLVLDHPLRGLDAGASETVTERIRQSCREGAAVILLADTLEEALSLGDEIIVMRDGEITARFDADADAPTSLDLLEKMV